MTAKKLMALVAAGATAVGGGCVRYQYNNLAIALAPCHDAPPAFPAPVRQKVYLFLMNGADVVDACGLTELRDGVVVAGYPKVYLAQQVDRAWYEREVRRVARDDPHARVVLVGFGSAADNVLCLAAGAAADGVPVDTVLLLDPACSKEAEAKGACRTVVLRSSHWKGTVPAGAEVVAIDGAGHLGLAKSLATLDVVVRAVAESAAKVGPLDGDPLPSIPLQYTPNPTPRGDPPEVIGPADEWDFLKHPPKSGVPAAPPDPPTVYLPRPPLPVSPQGEPEPPPGEPLPPPRAASFAPGAVAR